MNRRLLFIIVSFVIFIWLPNPASVNAEEKLKIENVYAFEEYGPCVLLSNGELISITSNKIIIDNIKSISCCYHNGLAIKSDGTLVSWGENDKGLFELKPKKVMDHVEAAYAGSSFSICLKDDGTVWTWGKNNLGQLGDGTNKDNNEPREIMSDVKEISATSCQSFAIKNDGSLWAWGYNVDGQLGDGSYTNRNTPAKIMDNVDNVAASDEHTLALTSSGEMWGWGFNFTGWDSDATKYSEEPKLVSKNVKKVFSSDAYSPFYYLTADNKLYGFGQNAFALLGDGTTKSSSEPVYILDNIVSLANCDGEYDPYTIALKNDNTVWIWGSITEDQKITKPQKFDMDADELYDNSLEGYKPLYKSNDKNSTLSVGDTNWIKVNMDDYYGNQGICPVGTINGNNVILSKLCTTEAYLIDFDNSQPRIKLLYDWKNNKSADLNLCTDKYWDNTEIYSQLNNGGILWSTLYYLKKAGNNVQNQIIYIDGNNIPKEISINIKPNKKYDGCQIISIQQHGDLYYLYMLLLKKASIGYHEAGIEVYKSKNLSQWTYLKKTDRETILHNSYNKLTKQYKRVLNQFKSDIIKKLSLKSNTLVSILPETTAYDYKKANKTIDLSIQAELKAKNQNYLFLQLEIYDNDVPSAVYDANGYIDASAYPEGYLSWLYLTLSVDRDGNYKILNMNDIDDYQVAGKFKNEIGSKIKPYCDKLQTLYKDEKANEGSIKEYQNKIIELYNQSFMNYRRFYHDGNSEFITDGTQVFSNDPNYTLCGTNINPYQYLDSYITGVKVNNYYQIISSNVNWEKLITKVAANAAWTKWKDYIPAEEMPYNEEGTLEILDSDKIDEVYTNMTSLESYGLKLIDTNDGVYVIEDSMKKVE